MATQSKPTQSKRAAVSRAQKASTNTDALGVRGRAQVLFQALHTTQHQLAALESQVFSSGLKLEDQFRPDRTFGEEIERLKTTLDDLLKKARQPELALVDKLIKRHHAQLAEQDAAEDERLGLDDDAAVEAAAA